jgi:hypothetical protein
MPTILIGADVCPIEGNLPYFQRGDTESLFHDLLLEMEGADLVIANLECPFIERPSPIQKTGPTFGVPGACVNGIQAAGIDVLCLANNHIMDHGENGLRHTLEVSARAGIETVGAGPNLEAARRLLIRAVGDLQVGILAMAEHEFSIASKDSWGAAPLDLIDFVRTINTNRESLDYFVVLLHAAAEFHVPTPRIQRTCRFMVEMGANAVIVQHPHILGGYEEYEGGHIVYGQGALVMDEAIYRDRPSFHEGFLVKLDIQRTEGGLSAEARGAKAEGLGAEVGGRRSEGGGQKTEDGGRPVHRSSESEGGRTEGRWRSQMEIIPFVQSQPVPGARRLTGTAEEELRQAVAKRSRLLLDEDWVEAEWTRFCMTRRHGCMSSLLGHGRILRWLNSRGGLERWLYRKRLLGVRNMVLCETHRETLQTLFQSRNR